MKKILYAAAVVVMMMASCGGDGKPDETQAVAPEFRFAEKDSMITGLTCDGTNDSVLVFLQMKEGAQPVTYSIVSAKAHGRIIGQPAIGDWLSVMLDPKDSQEVVMAVNIDEMKATWTHEVRPTWKDASKLSRRALARKMNEIPDSLREAYMVPREYGFTLKRNSVAEAVGRVRKQSSLEDDSPVEYPPVKNYVGWKCYNGHLFLVSRERAVSGSKTKPKEDMDTLDFVMMTEDSLVLTDTHSHERISFHRKANSRTANADAQKAAAKVEKLIK